MDSFVPLLTIFAVCLVIGAWPVVRHIASWTRPPGAMLKDSDLGLAQVRLPSGWRPARFLNDEASLQAADPLQRRYFIVISEPKADFEQPDLAEHSARTFDMLTSGLRVLAVSDIEDRQVGAYRVRQVEFEAVHEGTLLTYLHTTLEGTRAMHQVVGWATRSRYSRPVFESLIDGFEEMPAAESECVDVAPHRAALRAVARGSGRRIGF